MRRSWQADLKQAKRSAANKMSRESSIALPKPPSGWLVALMCMTMALPATLWAFPSAEGNPKRIESITLDLGISLQDSPVEPPHNGTHLEPHPDTETSSPCPNPASHEAQCRPGFLHASKSPSRTVRVFSLFLPRPPPFSCHSVNQTHL